jgi:fluoride exporter
MQQMLVIAVGAAVGANLRWWLAQWALARFGAGWPYGTFAVNLIGCLLIGLLYGWTAQRQPLNEPLRLLLVTGLLGGFTTFSSFGYETFSLLESGRWAAAAWYSGLSLVLGILCVWGGFAAGRVLG